MLLLSEKNVFRKGPALSLPVQVLIFNTIGTFGWSKNTDVRMARIGRDFPDRHTLDFPKKIKILTFYKKSKILEIIFGKKTDFFGKSDILEVSHDFL